MPVATRASCTSSCAGPAGLTLEEAQASAQEPLYRAALMVRRGEADGGVAVAIHNTGDVIRAAHACVWPARGIRTLSSSLL